MYFIKRNITFHDNIIFGIIIFLFSILSSGCMNLNYSTLSKDEVITKKKINISYLALNDGSGIIFDKYGGKLLKVTRNNNEIWIIYGTDRAGNDIEVNLEDVHEVNIEKREVDTYWVVLSILPAAVAILFLFLNC
jgi:hypothetical protein